MAVRGGWLYWAVQVDDPVEADSEAAHAFGDGFWIELSGPPRRRPFRLAPEHGLAEPLATLLPCARVVAALHTPLPRSEPGSAHLARFGRLFALVAFGLLTVAGIQRAQAYRRGDHRASGGVGRLR